MSDAPERKRFSLRWPLLLVGIVGIAVWLVFFDSHSLVRRYQWHREEGRLRQENARLEAEVDDLSKKLEDGLSDEVVEEIAREQYGMRRPGETVYRAEEVDDSTVVRNPDK